MTIVIIIAVAVAAYVAYRKYYGLPLWPKMPTPDSDDFMQ